MTSIAVILADYVIGKRAFYGRFLPGKCLVRFKPDQVVVPEKKEGTVAALLSESGIELILSFDLIATRFVINK